MLDFTIYSYGYSEIIYHTLQAIAMFRNSDFYTTIITTVALIAGFIYAVQMVAARGEAEWRGSLRRVIGMMIFIHALLLPKVTMSVKDHVEKHYWQVDNIPLAFALPIGIVESFGHILTAGFEQVFSLVDGASSHSYYHYGTVFGARLQKEVLQSKVHDPEFISNMSNFIERCVILPSMIGKQFTKEELVASEDMWGLISSRAGTFTRTPMTKNGIRVDPHPKCKDAVPYFEKKFDDTIGLNLTSWAWKFKGAGRDNKYNPGSRALNQNIKKQIGVLYGSSSNVDAVLKHNMMINAVHSYRSGKYPTAKAQLHNEAGGLISGDLAEKTLTGSLAVMKVIVYGSFIFLFPILILSGGIAKYQSWITAAFSLALWPSLFSMLNMIIDFAYEPAKVISYSTWSTEMKKFDSIASIAANLTLMIPFLSFWITRMGEGGFMHLAGSIMATANSASAALAGEKASGRREWDNESIRNQNNDNTSNYKHDSSMQYVSGTARSSMADGSMETITAGGKALYFSGAGQSASSGESSYRQMSGWSVNHDEAVRYEAQAISSETAAKSEAQEKLYASEASALHSIMEHTKTDTGYNIDTSTEEGREISKHLSAIDKLNSTNNYGWEQNAKSYISTEAGFSLQKWLLGARVSAGGEVSAGNNSSQSDSGSNEISSELGTNSRRSNSEHISMTESYLESLGIDKNTQNSIRENYQEVARLDKSISEHKNVIDSHNKTMNYAQSHSGEMSKDMYQETVDAYQQKYGGSARSAHEAVSEGTAKARGVFKELTEQSYQGKFNEIHMQANKIANSDNVNDFIKNNQIDSSIGSRRDAFAKTNNIRTDKENVALEISDKGELIKSLHTDKYKTNQEDYEVAQINNNDTQKVKQKQIEGYDKDRIGRGWASEVVGFGSNIISLGAGDNIGRPNEKANSHDLDFDDPIVKTYEPRVGRNNIESEKTSKLSPIRPPEEVKSFDKKEAQDIIESFNPDKLDDDNEHPEKAKGDGQYVDPKHK
jgi:TraG-like protein, N-terminal region